MSRSTPSDLVALGIDGDPRGWVVAAGMADRTTELRAFPAVPELWAWRAEEPGGTSAPALIDVPIGLADETGHRACDREAAARLGPRRACVFQPPGRYLLAACDEGPDTRAIYARVRDLVKVRRERAADPAAVKGLSAQAAGILAKVREVDVFLAADRARNDDLAECHPEVSFAAMNGDVPLAPKTSPDGRRQRLELIGAAFPDSAPRLRAWGRETGRSVIDALDAYAALWSALRWRTARDETLGDGARDALTGAPMRVVV